ncbi:hypothetical protein DC094_19285 [Pelagibaculum spongiae]|uniref:Uncharacterized protein n=1 Tax=Pelagibaculum spongiae TaxID=2080658 RepID=A0A2V1GPJ0_9GAMM|nr:hypothetical protein DC094_19285 [Pelagibaculum spongiae]
MSEIQDKQNIIRFSETDVEVALQSSRETILKGLYRGAVGFVIAPPDTGKSFFCMSIAYELAQPNSQLLGLIESDQPPLKTLIWPIEDTVPGILPRIKQHLAAFSIEIKIHLEKYVAFYGEEEAICCAGHLQNSTEETKAYLALQQLIEKARNYDLVVIDTLRDATGSADEVKDDYYIKTALEKLAKEADVALLVVHHPTKEVARGKEIINSVAGSGLSSTLSKSKLHIYLDRDLKNHPDSIRMRHIKANYLSADQQFTKPRLLHWSKEGILFQNEIGLQMLTQDLKEIGKLKPKTQKRKRSKISLEPIIIDTDKSLLSEESKKLAEQAEGPFGKGMADQLTEMMNKN